MPWQRFPTISTKATKLKLRLALVLALTFGSWAATANPNCPSTLDVLKRPLNGGEPIRLCDAYAGKVVVVVNTASKCGFTPQYDGLEALYERLAPAGLVILGFPSNDFGNQEPGTEKQIQDFCRLTYGVRFPMFEKTKVTGRHADPLYQRLAQRSGEYPRWNFHKYVLDRQGRLVGSFPSRTTPDDPELVDLIERLLRTEPAATTP